jgi:hypothetical protein
MTQFCQDTAILTLEPVVYLDPGDVCRSMIRGTAATLSGTTLSVGGADFIGVGVTAGMVVCTWSDAAAEGDAWEIVSVDSATQLTVSVLRASTDDDAIAPPAGTNLNFAVRTLAPTIADISVTLAERMRWASETAGIESVDFADSSQLASTTACGVLSAVFFARAAVASGSDPNWVKAEHYRARYQSMQLQLRLAVDADGDGVAESTRTLGNVTLRRR